MLFSKKLKVFDALFSEHGYMRVDYNSKNEYWKRMPEYRTYCKKDMLCIITDNKMENLIMISFYLIKMIDNNTFDFYRTIRGGYKQIDKFIDLVDYAKMIKGDSYLNLLSYQEKQQANLTQLQIAFLEDHLTGIEQYLETLR